MFVICILFPFLNETVYVYSSEEAERRRKRSSKSAYALLMIIFLFLYSISNHFSFSSGSSASEILLFVRDTHSLDLTTSTFEYSHSIRRKPTNSSICTHAEKQLYSEHDMFSSE